jgi:hypothetical protein
MSGAALGNVQYGISQLPKYTIGDSTYSKKGTPSGDSFVYGVANAGGVIPSYQVTAEGWVGVTTYNDSQGNLRVKKETLVAMSGITTGTTNYPTNA